MESPPKIDEVKEFVRQSHEQIGWADTDAWGVVDHWFKHGISGDPAMKLGPSSIPRRVWLCAKRWAREELDTNPSSPDRRLQHKSMCPVRFGAAHRELILSLAGDQRAEWERLVALQVVCGYFFFRFLWESKMGRSSPVDNRMFKDDVLYDTWLACLYTPTRGADVIHTAVCEDISSKDYGNMRRAWGLPVMAPIVMVCGKRGIGVDEIAGLLISNFDAGMVLEDVGMKAPSDRMVRWLRDGGEEKDMPQGRPVGQSGCLVVLAASSIAVASILLG